MKNKLLSKIKSWLILLISGSFWWKTSLLTQRKRSIGSWNETIVDVTECCGIIHVSDENYCPKCGRRIVKTK